MDRTEIPPVRDDDDVAGDLSSDDGLVPPPLADRDVPMEHVPADRQASPVETDIPVPGDDTVYRLASHLFDELHLLVKYVDECVLQRISEWPDLSDAERRSVYRRLKVCRRAADGSWRPPPPESATPANPARIVVRPRAFPSRQQPPEDGATADDDAQQNKTRIMRAMAAAVTAAAAAVTAASTAAATAAATVSGTTFPTSDGRVKVSMVMKNTDDGKVLFQDVHYM